MPEPERESKIITPKILARGEKAIQAGMSPKAFADIIVGVLDEGVAGVVENLWDDSQRMLTEHAQIRSRFEERLQARWHAALDLYEMVMVCCTEAGTDLHNDLSEQSQASEHPTKLHALTLLHARACMAGNEVFALLRTGFAVGAQARWRTLHEIAAISFVIGSGTEELAERFLLHRAVEHWKEAQCYQENCAALGREPLSTAELAQIRARYDEVVGRFEPGYERGWGWAKPLFASASHVPNFDDLAKLAGLGHNKPFVKLSHHAIHSGASGTRDVLELHGRGEVMLAGPSNAGLGEPAHGSLIALHQVTVAYLLNGPNEILPEDLLTLKAIAKLLDEAGEAFAECEAQLERDYQLEQETPS